MPAYDLNGKVALVTGAARGIGYETARQLHLRGASVAVLDLDAEQAREAAERIGERAIGIGADVTDHGRDDAAVAETVERFGGLDVVVANAGIAQKKMATVRGIAGEEWERVFEVDMLGVWRTVRAALPQIVERQRPRRRRLLRLRLRQRHAQQPLRGRQVRGRVAGPLAAGRADAARRQRQRRLLRLGRHEDGPGRLRPGALRPAPGTQLPTFLLQADHARRGRRRRSCGGSKSARRGSSPRSGGATSPPCAACSTRCSTGAWRATEDRGARSARSRPSAPTSGARPRSPKPSASGSARSSRRTNDS